MECCQRIFLTVPEESSLMRRLTFGEILPLETILQKARQKYPGRVLEVELEKKAGNKIVYEVEMLRNDGVIQEIYLDATSGEALYTEEK